MHLIESEFWIGYEGLHILAEEFCIFIQIEY